MSIEKEFDYSTIADLEGLEFGETAYIKQISAEKVLEILDLDEEVIREEKYWALFSDEGIPLMLSNAKEELEHSAFFNDLNTVLPN